MLKKFPLDLPAGAIPAQNGEARVTMTKGNPTGTHTDKAVEEICALLDEADNRAFLLIEQDMPDILKAARERYAERTKHQQLNNH